MRAFRVGTGKTSPTLTARPRTVRRYAIGGGTAAVPGGDSVIPPVSVEPPDPPLSDGIVVLRPMDDRDLPAIERASSDHEIGKWFDLRTRQPTEYLSEKGERWANGTGASFALCDATQPGTCLGHVFVERQEDDRGSIGYWLLEDARGRGLATRGVGLTARWALSALALSRLELHTDLENVASQRVAERAGFTREGVLGAYTGRTDGTRADAVVYSLTPHDLSARR
jgi:RimJ/RimL family protein N-acetyltransferase